MVLIDMPMPDRCLDCPFFKKHSDCGQCRGTRKGKWIEPEDYDKRQDWCPLKSLPSAQSEPTTEIQEILNYLDTTLHPIISPDNWNVYAELHDMVSKLLSAQPKQKPGKWIYGEDEHGVDGYHCDECGFFVPWDYVHKFINYIEDYNFCPNCGARMDGKDSDLP